MEKSISKLTLNRYYEHYEKEYGSTFPSVLNPKAFVEGVKNLMNDINDHNGCPSVSFLFVVDSPDLSEEPEYVLVIANEADLDPDVDVGLSIRLIYAGTNETEWTSVVDERSMRWAPLSFASVEHEGRDKCYMGFCYLLCSRAPGFDIEEVPELELTGQELLEMGVEGDIPPEAILLPEFSSSEPPESAENQGEFEAEEEGVDASVEITGAGDGEVFLEVDDEDGNRIVAGSETLTEEEESIMNDIQAEFEELFA